MKRMIRKAVALALALASLTLIASVMAFAALPPEGEGTNIYYTPTATHSRGENWTDKYYSGNYDDSWCKAIYKVYPVYKQQTTIVYSPLLSSGYCSTCLFHRDLSGTYLANSVETYSDVVVAHSIDSDYSLWTNTSYEVNRTNSYGRMRYTTNVTDYWDIWSNLTN